MERKNGNMHLVKNPQEDVVVQELRKPTKVVDRTSNDTCKKQKLYKAKEAADVTSKSKKLKLKSSPEQLEILSVKENNGQVLIEFRAPSTSVLPISENDDEPYSIQTNPKRIAKIKVDEVDIKKEEMEFCALNSTTKSISATDNEELNNQIIVDEFTVIKIEDEFGATSISVQPISTNDTKIVNGDSIAIKFEDEVNIKLEDEMEFCDLSSTTISIPYSDDKDQQEKLIDIEWVMEEDVDKSAEPKWNKNKSKFICDICSREYSSKGNFAAHRKLHFTCYVCSKEYLSKSSLAKHRKCHGINRIYFTCDICMKKFVSKGSRLEHGKLHGKANCHFTVRGVAKITKRDVNLHRTMHDTKPNYFTCDICSKKYSKKRSLTIHQLCHVNANFHCSICGMYKFTQVAMDKHMRTHDTNPIFYTCDVCPRKFSKEKYLSAHRLRHGNNSNSPVDISLRRSERERRPPSKLLD